MATRNIPCITGFPLKRILLVVAFGFYFLTSFSQKTPVPKLIRHLIQQQGSIPIISGATRHLVPPEQLPAYNRDEFQNLIRTEDALFCNISGTGWLYQITDSNGVLRFNRVDSSFYTGDNFNALHFIDQTRIYSFGGYGFWRTNGILRKFNGYTHEWDVIKVDSEIPFSTGYLNWYDTASKQLYFSPPEFYQDAFRNDSGAYQALREHIYALDINTGKWTMTGQLIRHFRGVSIPCKWGILSIYGPDSAVLLNFSQNEVYRLSDRLVSQFNKFFIRKNKDFYYFIDSTFYFGNIENDVFDSIRLFTASFVPTGERFIVFKGPLKSDYGTYFSASAILFAAIATLLILRRRKPGLIDVSGRGNMQKKPSPTENQPGLYQVKFSNIELEVLKVLYRNSLKNTDTTQEELNQLLGLSSKKLSIQKKYRNDIIVSVNQKWMIGQNTTDTLIERKRSSEDKRIYHYAITQQFLDQLAGLFPDKNNPNPGSKRPPGV